jgi:uncharacterized RDD family membrane protein YckC
MRWTDDIQIETPEQIDVSLELAGLGSRFVARLIDWIFKWIILLVALVVGAILFGLLGVSVPLNDPLKATGAAQMLLLLSVVAGYAFFLGYDVYFELRRNGQTPGKRWTGIRVIREGGAPLDFRSACIRSLLAMADFLPVFYLLGAVLMVGTARKQRLGDLAAGTVVIRERVLNAPADLSKEVERLASHDFVFTAEQLAPCYPEGRHILRSFFQRYPELQSEPREQLACRLAGEFAGKTTYPLEVPVTSPRRALTFLASLYRDLERLKQHGR